MKRKRWGGTVPALVTVCGLGGAWVALPGLHPGSAPAPTRIVDDRFLEQEARAGMPLYAPSWLPHEGMPGPVGTRPGIHRILSDYTDSQGLPICIVAQERRTPERDRYHHRYFQAKSDAQGRIGESKTGYFITGKSGERRLFWFEPDMALVVSSSAMTDPELLRVAASTRNK